MCIRDSFHTLIQLLRRLHGTAGGKAQLAAGLLLQGGGDKGRCRGNLAGTALHRSHGEGSASQLGQDGVGLLLIFDFQLTLFGAVEPGGEDVYKRQGFMGPKRIASSPRPASTSMGIQPS